MTEEKDLNKSENASAGSTEKEEIIDLTDEIKTTPQNDEEIIELMDEVVKTDSTDPAEDVDSAPQAEPDIPAASEMSPETDETSAPETAPAAFLDGEIKIGDDDIDDEIDFDEGEQDDFMNSMGMDLETDSAISQLPEENESLPEPAPAETAPINTDAISSGQIEAAIERVVMKILPEKIDGILSATIEKTLTREIDKIKGLLLEDSSGDNL
ncbi:MAG: hypothetical protein P1P89_19515 [Desulfobacterales bacterium]|nr:hypothetical protein [Desulfobacterales bacterium]